MLWERPRRELGRWPTGGLLGPPGAYRICVGVRRLCGRSANGTRCAAVRGSWYTKANAWVWCGGELR